MLNKFGNRDHRSQTNLGDEDRFQNGKRVEEECSETRVFDLFSVGECAASSKSGQEVYDFSWQREIEKFGPEERYSVEKDLEVDSRYIL